MATGFMTYEQDIHFPPAYGEAFRGWFGMTAFEAGGRRGSRQSRPRLIAKGSRMRTALVQARFYRLGDWG